MSARVSLPLPYVFLRLLFHQCSPTRRAHTPLVGRLGRPCPRCRSDAFSRVRILSPKAGEEIWVKGHRCCPPSSRAIGRPTA